MAAGQNRQLENVINEVLKTGDSQELDIFLQRNDCGETLMKCSQEFVSKLDKLINKSLDKNDLKAAALGLVSLWKYGNNLKLFRGGQGLPGLITHGLINKWFEKCRQLWIQCGPRWDETLFTLSEDFLNALMVVHEASKEGTYKITESFLYPLGQLAVDPRIYILIQKEAIFKFNSILDKIPLELTKKRNILKSQEATDIMTKLACHISESGDFDFQSSLTEALCRMATHDQRRELAYRWFSMGHVASAFVQIVDSEFDTACRRFLNMVNGMLGDKRRVCSYPCLEVYLDKYELLMPTDRKLEEFWIDFNLGSHSISFYFTLADEEAEESPWETMSVSENDVATYTVSEEGERKVLHIKLSEVFVVGSVEGSSLTIHFTSALDIQQAVRNVFRNSKRKAKSGVKSMTQENSTQVVPESQVSPSGSEKNSTHDVWPAPSAAVQMATPAKTKFSESTTLICYSAGGSVHNARSLPAVSPNTSAQCKETSLEKCHALIHGSANAISNEGKRMSVPEAGAVMLTGQEEEHDFVPDSQPRTRKNTTKLSTFEMLVMPTQKFISLSQAESNSSVGQQQERAPCLTRKCSVSDSTPICQKRLHKELTQRLQKVLDERNQVPTPQDGASPQRKMSVVKADSKVARSGGQNVSTLSVPKVTPGQRNARSTEKRKKKPSLELEAFSVKASAVNTTTPESHQGKTPPLRKGQSDLAVSSKIKRHTEVVGSLVKKISTHYKTKAHSAEKYSANTSQIFPPLIRPVFNMSWMSFSKKEQSRAFNHSSTTTTFLKQKDDVFAFSNESSLLIGGEKKTFTNTSGMAHSGIHNSSVPQKRQLLGEKGKRYVKKHLFSDTDTDSAKAEISWLRNSNKKAKPKITKYPKRQPVKPVAAPLQTSWESTDSPPPSTKAVKDNKKPTKTQPKKTAKPAAVPSGSPAAGKRPKRAAAISAKSYKEPDTDDSQSDIEIPPLPPPPPPPQSSFIDQQETEREETSGDVPKKKKHIFSERPPDNTRRRDVKNKSGLKNTSGLKQQRPTNVFQETSDLNKENAAAKKQKCIEKGPRPSHQASRRLSPHLIEKMRSGERSGPNLDLTSSPLLSPRGSPLLASPNPPHQDTLLLTNPRCAVSSKGNCLPSSFYSPGKSLSSFKTPSIHSIASCHSHGGQTSASSLPCGSSVGEKTDYRKHFSSASQSPFSLPTQALLTSTAIKLAKPPVPSPLQSPFPEDTVSNGHYHDMSNGSTSTRSSQTQSSYKSSVRTSRGNTAMIVSFAKEKTPLSDLLVSGPCRKRQVSISSDSEEDKKKGKKSKMRMQHSPRMKPRKLFKSFTDVSAVEELSQVMSASHIEFGMVDEDLDMDEDFEMPETAAKPRNLPQHFSAELRKKFQKRYKMMEVYNRQSLKTVQQYVSSVNMQVTEQRTQRLEKVQKVLLKEIEQLQQDDKVLKSMEKDLTVYWRKQTSTFHSYKIREATRNETLKRTLQSNACHSLEYEERIFTSQMHLMRTNMKSVQDRLLSEMQDKDIQSMKKGLHSLFFP